ncbi:MAG: thioredoxin domain-containing protein [Rhodospirillales bacterium]|nr:thioredoxin domain-containing protein [Rhodospirillales bacterium]
MDTNRLGAETSPYLLQHRDNPVHWWSWGDSALSEAQRLDKPILLSIGYSACHWCHVMAHESFEDPGTAALMNELFINIKVDREERPDLDMLYQSALAMLGEQGGWPLTMFLTPSGEPFWGGTYFPPSPRFGRPAFAQVLQQLSSVYRDQRDKVSKNVEALRGGLDKLATPDPGLGLKETAVDDVAMAALRIIDPVRGGTAGPPKFPQPVFFRFLWRSYLRTASPLYRDAVILTLEEMCQGGIYDHLAGGFARYATDVEWLVPHFEKMLYDNAQIIHLLGEVWLSTHTPLFANRIAETIGWVLSDLRIDGPSTGTFAFASAFDADSEGQEGRYYVWQQSEIEALLGDDAALFCAAYDVSPTGNWEGKTILRRSRTAPQDDSATAERLAGARARLLEQRQTRIPPLRDDKVLADWNGLMIDALASASVLFDRPDWLTAARTAFRFVTEEMQHDGRLLHSWCRGRAAHPAVLEDYANMARAAISLYQATGDHDCLALAVSWVDITDRYYWDETASGYFVSASDTTDILVRSKSIADHAVPSGNGVMVEVLARLFYLTGDEARLRRAERLVELFSGENQQYLLGIPGFLTASEWLSRPVCQIAIIGDPEDSALRALRLAALTSPRPLKVVQSIAPAGSLPTCHPAAGKTMIDGRATAYVCVGQSCGLPIQDADVLRAAITA